MKDVILSTRVVQNALTPTGRDLQKVDFTNLPKLGGPVVDIPCSSLTFRELMTCWQTMYARSHPAGGVSFNWAELASLHQLPEDQVSYYKLSYEGRGELDEAWHHERNRAGVYRMRLPVPDTFRKNFHTQSALLAQGEEIPPPALMLSALLYAKAQQSYFFQKIFFPGQFLMWDEGKGLTRDQVSQEHAKWSRVTDPDGPFSHAWYRCSTWIDYGNETRNVVLKPGLHPERGCPYEVAFLKHVGGDADRWVYMPAARYLGTLKEYESLSGVIDTDPLLCSYVREVPLFSWDQNAKNEIPLLSRMTKHLAAQRKTLKKKK